MAGNDDARRLWFRKQVLPLEAMLRGYAVRFCTNIACEPDDLVQDTFARLISCDAWSEIANVRSFAIATLRNVALQVARRSKIVSIQAVSDLEKLEIPNDAPSADRIVQGRDELALLARTVESLPPQCRKVFTLRKFDGLSNKDIADQLGLSISTVEKHIIKGLRLCSEALAKDTASTVLRGHNGSEFGHVAGWHQAGGRRMGHSSDSQFHRAGTRPV